ncbi:phytanoyl-CoA dioxygenase family protein [Ferrovibrio terrae]|uniref:phytanoyl-CoA dioxygenase family protein n=1 Tax=Ferrovibrio terrae TaxID=2594003 RepID=UPI003137B5AC
MTTPEPVHAHAVLRRDSADTEVERHVEEIRRIGLTIIRNAFTRAQMEDARARLHEIYARQVAEVGGEDNLFLIKDANIVRTPVAYDDAFLAICKHPLALAVARACLGNAITLSAQVGILNKPGITNYVNHWHRELQYQHLTSSRPLAVQTLVAVDDFTFDNGATFFLPGTHLFENFPSDDFVRKWEVQFEAPAGSIFMFDSMTYHRGAPNRTDKPRVAINNLYTLPIIAQQIDIASMLGGRHAETAEDRQLFGYQWNPPRSVQAWRQQKIDAAQKPG